MKRLRTKRNNTLEEYAYELTPGVKEIYSADKKLRTGMIYGLLAIFFSLLALFLFPLISGLVGIIFGYKAVSYGAKVIGYTAIGFSMFSIIVSIVLF
jgi:xanthosine utilization system XapX-like protein